MGERNVWKGEVNEFEEGLGKSSQIDVPAVTITFDHSFKAIPECFVIKVKASMIVGYWQIVQVRVIRCMSLFYCTLLNCSSWTVDLIA